MRCTRQYPFLSSFSAASDIWPDLYGFSEWVLPKLDADGHQAQGDMPGADGTTYVYWVGYQYGEDNEFGGDVGVTLDGRVHVWDHRDPNGKGYWDDDLTSQVQAMLK